MPTVTVSADGSSKTVDLTVSPATTSYWDGAIPDLGQPFSKTVWPHQSMVDTHVSPQPDPKGSGQTVMRFAIPDGDFPYAETYASRADFESRPMFGPSENASAGEYSDVYFGLDWLADPALSAPPLASGGRTAFYGFLELYGPPLGGTPNVALGVHSVGSDNYVGFHRNVGGTATWEWSAPKPVDTAWHSYVLHVKWSPNPAVGFVELWYDGAQQKFGNVATKFSYATLLSGVNWNGNDSSKGWNFVNCMSYRSVKTWPETITTYFRNIKVGPTLASVS